MYKKTTLLLALLLMLSIPTQLNAITKKRRTNSTSNNTSAAATNNTSYQENHRHNIHPPNNVSSIVRNNKNGVIKICLASVGASTALFVYYGRLNKEERQQHSATIAFAVSGFLYVISQTIEQGPRRMYPTQQPRTQQTAVASINSESMIRKRIAKIGLQTTIVATAMISLSTFLTTPTIKESQNTESDWLKGCFILYCTPIIVAEEGLKLYKSVKYFYNNPSSLRLIFGKAKSLFSLT